MLTPCWSVATSLIIGPTPPSNEHLRAVRDVRAHFITFHTPWRITNNPLIGEEFFFFFFERTTKYAQAEKDRNIKSKNMKTEW